MFCSQVAVMLSLNLHCIATLLGSDLLRTIAMLVSLLFADIANMLCFFERATAVLVNYYFADSAMMLKLIEHAIAMMLCLFEHTNAT